MPNVAVSGGFDPVHIGHIRMILEAATYKKEIVDAKITSGRLFVFLNSDDWLRRKKGYVFQSFSERAEILSVIQGVDMVIPVYDNDDTVCETIKQFLKAGDIFCNGGDRFPENTPELKTCCDLGIQMKFNVGGEKIQSSSELIRKVTENVL